MSAGSKLRGGGAHAATLAWAGVTAAALLLPTSELSGWMPGIPWVRLALVFAGWGLDKLVHGTLFGVLAWLAVGSSRSLALRRPALTVLAVATLYAVALEAAQHWVPDRRADTLDLLADIVGIILGLWLARRILRRA